MGNSEAKSLNIDDIKNNCIERYKLITIKEIF